MPLPTQTGPIEWHYREIREVKAGKSCYTEPPHSPPWKSRLLSNSPYTPETTFKQPLRLFTTSLPTTESDTFQTCSQPAAKGHNTSTKEFVIAFKVSGKIKGKKKKKGKKKRTKEEHTVMQLIVDESQKHLAAAVPDRFSSLCCHWFSSPRSAWKKKTRKGQGDILGRKRENPQ